MSGYDNPKDINEVELKIKSVTGNPNPEIYANGRHQLPILIEAKAIARVQATGEDKILKFERDTWIHLLNLRYADTDEKLNWRGSSEWCYTQTPNEFSGGFKDEGFVVTGSGSIIIKFFVYVYGVGSKRIAVSIDTDNGKHFTTADTAAGVEKMSLLVTAVSAVNYFRSDLNVVNIKSETIKAEHVDDRDYQVQIITLDHYYENYYIGFKSNVGIVKAEIHIDGAGDEDRKWIAVYQLDEDKNTHLIALHPFDNIKKTAGIGFDNFGRVGAGGGLLFKKLRLKQEITFNDRIGLFCLSYMFFKTNVDPNTVIGNLMAMGKNDVDPFSLPSWFEIYDEHGNSGRFKVDFAEKNKSVEITDK
ncbi:hypothetical protein HA402_000220 [Bradysia odoriphaga]|nr:hypothetical protein HA402_000220 [Bradysia odoriphaga]